MNPTQFPIEPSFEQPSQPTGRKISGRTKAALWLMIGPTALLICSFLLFAVLNWVASTTTDTAPSTTSQVTSNSSNQPQSLFGDNTESSTQPETLFGEPSPVSIVGNVILFIVGAIAVLTTLPGLIIGIVLLATQKK